MNTDTQMPSQKPFGGTWGKACFGRWLLMAFGWLNVGLGIVGVFVPGMPSTVFLIVAAWAFSRCSERFHMWLWNHPRLGSAIQAWHRHRAIPLRAKILAIVSMSVSFLGVTFFAAQGWVLPVLMASVMAPSACYIVTRPHGAPTRLPSASSGDDVRA